MNKHTTPSPLYITAINSFETTSPEEMDLKAHIKDIFGKQIRRIGPFIQLALIGAAPVIRHSPLPEATNVYLTSGSGDMDVTIDVLNRTVRDKLTPKPLSFINTVSNAACYYLTKHFAIGGSTSFLSTRGFSLESAFLQALTDAKVFNVETAIVGSVDILTQDETSHRIRVGATPNEPLAQGTHWFRLNANAQTAPSIGQLHHVSMHSDSADLIEKIKPNLTDRTFLGLGNRTTVSSQKELKALNLKTYTPNHPSKGHYGTNMGHTLYSFLEDNSQKDTQLLHVQENSHGELSAVIISKS